MVRNTVIRFCRVPSEYSIFLLFYFFFQLDCFFLFVFYKAIQKMRTSGDYQCKQLHRF